MFSLKNKNVVITGGASGIGRAIAVLFASQGASIYIIDVDVQAGEATAEAIKKDGFNAQFTLCDITNLDAVTAVFDKISDIDILINNAGVAHVGNASNTLPADFQRVMDINVKGAYNCLHAVIPLMQRNKRGAILNTASIAAHVGITNRFAYSASKGAIYAMTMSVARDYLADNIRCNSISPARVHTPFVDGFIAKNYPGREAEMFKELSDSQPIKRMGTPEEVAMLALFLCADESAFITGCDYLIDGGFVHLNN
ncbi:SDR family NAD(P)-dependent oxidoreductase [Mucilaginibacter sp. X4EP1]|uniref:SDR family NAD(P)-dependent oxidoreductase n=1 Tax=Mucilaginibacter sp. X4EP1 TaxID=2723092 RepID=UPI002168AFA1|nr:SDR family oxidoreductase [Mucilaginibacter sp. X4EP1]MCS3812473.1 NAD(P)-dependent dehydrogenase (short-subunit alcohol dehydrogenase family) [Mucilaginibacter sp. X4EP1]